MYDYLQIKICQELFQEASAFCRKNHNSDEVITYCLQTMNNFFRLHECTFFHQPTKMDKIVYTDLLSIFREYLKKKSIVFSLKQIIGPQYTELKIYHRKNESPQEASRGEKYIHNIDRRLTSRIPVFFGIKYTSGKKIKDKKGWTPSKNPDSIMQEHKKLYDILYSCCHQACDIDNKQSKMLFGNLSKPSIFRFDRNVEGNYRNAFDHIQRELIYRFPDNDSYSKLVSAINISLHTSQMRSAAFSIINQLMTHREHAPISFTTVGKVDSNDDFRYFERLYDYIIQKCKNVNTITVRQREKDIYVNTINMDISDKEAILFYAYAFFSNLPTTDYLAELHAILTSKKTTIDKVIVLSKEYIYHRDQTMFSVSLQQASNYIISGEFIPYSVVNLFITDIWNKIVPVICIDGFKKGTPSKFCNDHKKYMIDFIRLYILLFKQDMNHHMHIKHLLDLLHLYVMLKRCKVDIPTASIGYNKNDADEKRNFKPKPVKIDTAMDLIREKWKYQANTNGSTPSEIYMKTVIIETYLSAVMYMVVHGFNCNLFLKRIDATQKLFNTLLQHIPSITLINDKDVDYDEIIHKLLDWKK